MEKLSMFLKENYQTILMAITILVIGTILAKILKNASVKFMKKAKIERAAISFLSQILYAFLIFIVCINFLNSLGIPTTSLMASIGAIGLAIGLSIKDSFSNFAAGIILLIFKPFKADEYIEICGNEGVVKAIHIMNTEIINKENKVIIIPNSTFTNNSIINYSANNIRKIKLILDIAYDTDHKKAIEILRDIFDKNKNVLNNKEIEIGLFNFASSSVQIIAYPEVTTKDYWKSYYSIMDQIKIEFDRNNIEIPFTNQTIHIKSK